MRQYFDIKIASKHIYLQKLPKMTTEYLLMTASKKRCFSSKLLKATLPSNIQYGEPVIHLYPFAQPLYFCVLGIPSLGVASQS